MDRIIEGVQNFQDEVFPKRRALFQRLAQGQKPEALIIACSDSRISLDLITQAAPGELFVCRNAGNMAPSYGRSDAVCASIEYALTALPIRDIIVCGHSDCGAMKGILHPESLSEMPQVKDWLMHGQGALCAIEREGIPPHSYGAQEALTKLNVRLQLEHLHTYPQVFARVLEGSLRLHGWYYKIADGEVQQWEAGEGAWIPLSDAVPARPAKRRAAGSQEASHA